jgi:hypothetical protein
MDTTTVRLVRLINIVTAKYIGSDDVNLRRKCVETVLTLFKKFVEYKSGETGDKPEASFASLGDCMGRFIPRCTDPDVKTRLMAMESIEACLFINHMLESSTDEEGYNMQPPQQLQVCLWIERFY